MFDKKGYLVVEKEAVDEDTLMEVALEAGAEDVREDGANFEVICVPNDFEPVKAAIEAGNIPFAAAEITMLPQKRGRTDGSPDGCPRRLRRCSEGLYQCRYPGRDNGWMTRSIGRAMGRITPLKWLPT